jgi:transposase
MIAAKDKRFRFDLRRRLAADARKLGIKAAARSWHCSRNTVRLWMRRFDAEGLAGLKGRSHAPRRCPHKTSPEVEKKVLHLRRRTGYGPRRLKMEFDLPCGHGAIARILRAHKLTRRRRTRRQKKNDLRAVKAALAAFETVHMDIKYLNDIPEYLPQMRLRGLPEYQYTIRDVRTGLLFLAFADQISKSHACVCVRRFLRHLGRYNVPLSRVTIQTDNGSEFDGQLSASDDRGFIHAIEALAAAHRFIPPGCSNANADVESSHALIESEFYERERFRGTGEFLAKAWTYPCHFNLTRKNSYQGWRTPLERLAQAAPELSARVTLLAPVFLDSLLPSAPRGQRASLRRQGLQSLIDPAARTPPGGQHQPGHPVAANAAAWPRASRQLA